MKGLEVGKRETPDLFQAWVWVDKMSTCGKQFCNDEVWHTSCSRCQSHCNCVCTEPVALDVFCKGVRITCSNCDKCSDHCCCSRVSQLHRRVSDIKGAHHGREVEDDIRGSEPKEELVRKLLAQHVCAIRNGMSNMMRGKWAKREKFKMRLVIENSQLYLTRKYDDLKVRINDIDELPFANCLLGGGKDPTYGCLVRDRMIIQDITCLIRAGKLEIYPYRNAKPRVGCATIFGRWFPTVGAKVKEGIETIDVVPRLSINVVTSDNVEISDVRVPTQVYINILDIDKVIEYLTISKEQDKYSNVPNQVCLLWRRSDNFRIFADLREVARCSKNGDTFIYAKERLLRKYNYEKKTMANFRKLGLKTRLKIVAGGKKQRKSGENYFEILGIIENSNIEEEMDFRKVIVDKIVKEWMSILGRDGKNYTMDIGSVCSDNTGVAIALADSAMCDGMFRHGSGCYLPNCRKSKTSNIKLNPIRLEQTYGRSFMPTNLGLISPNKSKYTVAGNNDTRHLVEDDENWQISRDLERNMLVNGVRYNSKC